MLVVKRLRYSDFAELVDMQQRILHHLEMLAAVMVDLTQGALWGKKSGAQGAAIERFGICGQSCNPGDPATRFKGICIIGITYVRGQVALGDGQIESL